MKSVIIASTDLATSKNTQKAYFGRMARNISEFPKLKEYRGTDPLKIADSTRCHNEILYYACMEKRASTAIEQLRHLDSIEDRTPTISMFGSHGLSRYSPCRCQRHRTFLLMFTVQSELDIDPTVP